jgi:hypothetical protein
MLDASRDRGNSRCAAALESSLATLQMGSRLGGARVAEAHATAWEFAGVAHASGNAAGLCLADNLWIPGWPKTLKQPFPEATNVATRKFLSTVKAVPAGCVFAAGRIVRASYNHRTAGWTVLIRTEHHAARVFINASQFSPRCSQIEIS